MLMGLDLLRMSSLLMHRPRKELSQPIYQKVSHSGLTCRMSKNLFVAMYGHELFFNTSLNCGLRHSGKMDFIMDLCNRNFS